MAKNKITDNFVEDVEQDVSKETPAFWRNNLDYGERKTANIRGENVRDCPFGLPLIDACLNVGEAINRMAPVEEGDTATQKANQLVYAYHKDCSRCPYADKLIKDKNKVHCDYGDTGEGQQGVAFRGSPLYTQMFSSSNGIYGYPLGLYGDAEESRNMFFGLFSLLGKIEIDKLIKTAEKYDECGNSTKADIIDNLLNNLYSAREEDSDAFDKIKKYLDDCRAEHEESRIDTGKIWKLIQNWQGIRR